MMVDCKYCGSGNELVPLFERKVLPNGQGSDMVEVVGVKLCTTCHRTIDLVSRHCPKCEVELDNVIVYSECSQIASVESGELEDFRNLEVEGILRLICPECDEVITEVFDGV